MEQSIGKKHVHEISDLEDDLEPSQKSLSGGKHNKTTVSERARKVIQRPTEPATTPKKRTTTTERDEEYLGAKGIRKKLMKRPL